MSADSKKNVRSQSKEDKNARIPGTTSKSKPQKDEKLPFKQVPTLEAVPLESKQIAVFKQHTYASLWNSMECTFCNGRGHKSGQCGTLRNVDAIMKKNPNFADDWRDRKKQSINKDYHKKKEEKVGFVLEKLQTEKKYLESQSMQLRISSELFNDLAKSKGTPNDCRKTYIEYSEEYKKLDGGN